MKKLSRFDQLEIVLMSCVFQVLLWRLDGAIFFRSSRRVMELSASKTVGAEEGVRLLEGVVLSLRRRIGQLAGKEVDIGLDGGRDKPLRPADMLLYSCDGGLPLTQTEMVDFVPGRAVIDAAQSKCDKYMDVCVAIGYGFLPFSFSYLHLEVLHNSVYRGMCGYLYF
nr:hypothetical protein [Tanacetum cinerariifolium]